LVYCTPSAVKWLKQARDLGDCLPLPRETRRRALALMATRLGLATREDEGKKFWGIRN
jgi:hypothetical protein